MAQAAFVSKNLNGLIVELHGPPAIVVLKASFDGKAEYHSHKIAADSKHLIKYPSDLFKLGHVQASVFPLPNFLVKDSAIAGGSGNHYCRDCYDNGIYAHEHVPNLMPPSQLGVN